MNKQVMNILIPVLLFILLAPGFILTIPPQSKGLIASGQSNLSSVLVHAVVFALIYFLLRKYFPQYY
jgi:hypothetical protein